MYSNYYMDTAMNSNIQNWLKNHLVQEEYTQYGWQERPHYEFDEAEIKEFTELIVKECISAVEDTNDRYRKDYFANRIREHFNKNEKDY